MTEQISPNVALDSAAPLNTNVVLDPTTPLNTAYDLIERKYTFKEARTLYYHSDEFLEWTGTHYKLIEANTMREVIYHFMDGADCPAGNGTTMPFKATKKRVNDVVDALMAATNLRSSFQPPCWLLPGKPSIAPTEIIACKNGLLHIPTRKLLPHTPVFFTRTALPYRHDPRASQPTEWFKFLDSLWGSDTAAKDTLQEMLGYLLTSETSQQKIFALIGPTRSGKGVIARTMTKLLGSDNVAGPTLASLQTNFGLAPLIGKQAAIVADARLGGRADQQAIAERLLSISGEDVITIDRKYREPWTGRLPARFFILSNELPGLADASGALAKRFIVLVLTRSFYGREDHGLESRLEAEMPSILNWVLDGRDRLSQRGYFVQPPSSAEVVQELEDLGSPISAFLRECCDIGEGWSVDIENLYSAWQRWCIRNGRDRPGTTATFGRYLRAALPVMKVSQPRDGSKGRKRVRLGLRLKQSE
jgi:putative DNA primase/helicase